jgi:hypothetical protein
MHPSIIPVFTFFHSISHVSILATTASFRNCVPPGRDRFLPGATPLFRHPILLIGLPSSSSSAADQTFSRCHTPPWWSLGLGRPQHQAAMVAAGHNVPSSCNPAQLRPAMRPASCRPVRFWQLAPPAGTSRVEVHCHRGRHPVGSRRSRCAVSLGTPDLLLLYLFSFARSLIGVELPTAR